MHDYHRSIDCRLHAIQAIEVGRERDAVDVYVEQLPSLVVGIGAWGFCAFLGG